MAQEADRLTRGQASKAVVEYIGHNATTLASIGQSVDVFQRRAQEAALFSQSLVGRSVSPQSLQIAARKMCQTGLIPDGEEAALVPFKDRKTGITTVTFMPMWKGLAKLAWQVLGAEIHRGMVYEDDTVRRVAGVGVAPVLEITSQPFAGKKKAIGCWASMHILGSQFVKAEQYPRYVTLELEDIDAAMQRSASARKKEGPWISDWEKMALKTAVKQLIGEVGFMFLALPERYSALGAAIDADTEFAMADADSEIVEETEVQATEADTKRKPRQPRRARNNKKDQAAAPEAGKDGDGTTDPKGDPEKPAEETAPAATEPASEGDGMQAQAAPEAGAAQTGDDKLMEERDAPNVSLPADQIPGFGEDFKL